MKTKTKTTFDQLMQAIAIKERRHSSLIRAETKVSKLKANFPDCTNKLYKFNGKTYVVSSEVCWGAKTVSIDEVSE